MAASLASALSVVSHSGNHQGETQCWNSIYVIKWKMQVIHKISKNDIVTLNNVDHEWQKFTCREGRQTIAPYTNFLFPLTKLYVTKRKEMPSAQATNF